MRTRVLARNQTIREQYEREIKGGYTVTVYKRGRQVLSSAAIITLTQNLSYANVMLPERYIEAILNMNAEISEIVVNGTTVWDDSDGYTKVRGVPVLSGIFGKKVEEIIEKIAKANGVGKFYVRSILKDQGVDIQRKSVYNRKDSGDQLKRNAHITEMLQAGKTVADIAKKYGLTETRIRQITKGLIAKNADYTAEVEEMSQMIQDGYTYDDVVEHFGKDTVKAVKSKAGYNVYREVLRYQNDAIVRMFKQKAAPLDIAEHFGLTRDSVYLILKKNGLTSRISKEEKRKRDEEIVAMSKKKTPLEKIASKHNLTTTMVRIIISNSKAKKKAHA